MKKELKFKNNEQINDRKPIIFKKSNEDDKLNV